MFAFYGSFVVNAIVRFLRQGSVAQRLTALALALVVASVALALYALLVRGFGAVADNAFLARALPILIYELFLGIVFLFIFAGSLISGLFSLFSGRGDAWLVASPRAGAVPWLKLLVIGLLSQWPLLVIALPALVAMTSVFSVGPFGALLGLTAILVVGALASVLALTLIMLVAVVLRHGAGGVRARRAALMIGTVTLALAGVILALAPLGTLDVTALFAPQDLSVEEAALGPVVAPFAHLPTHHAAWALAHVQVGAAGPALARLLVLAGMLALVLFLYALLARHFAGLWQYFQEGVLYARAEGAAARVGSTAQFGATHTGALLRKELLTFTRSARDLLWLLFLAGLWLLVSAFDLLARDSLQSEVILGVTGREFIQSLQLLVVAYFAAAIALRFAFPAFSMERDSAWGLLSAPVSLRELFLVKALFFGGLFLALGGLIAAVHLVILTPPLLEGILFLCVVMTASVTLAVLALSIGARFPNFTTTDPQLLSTTMPGLLYMLAAILYGALGALGLLLYFSTATPWALLTFLTVSALTLFYLPVRALAGIDRTEFVGRTMS
ncbi:hypothetical protein GVX82_04740 [Patescibacteria group bacterium]|jgi:ABC-2 type transport system permease protein|nr:hypothetical protein [Patescibacteria group bacterium]